MYPKFIVLKFQLSLLQNFSLKLIAYKHASKPLFSEQSIWIQAITVKQTEFTIVVC